MLSNGPVDPDAERPPYGGRASSTAIYGRILIGAWDGRFPRALIDYASAWAARDTVRKLVAAVAQADLVMRAAQRSKCCRPPNARL